MNFPFGLLRPKQMANDETNDHHLLHLVCWDKPNGTSIAHHLFRLVCLNKPNGGAIENHLFHLVCPSKPNGGANGNHLSHLFFGGTNQMDSTDDICLFICL